MQAADIGLLSQKWYLDVLAVVTFLQNWILEMQDVEPGWDKVLRIAWLLTWRGLFGGLVIGFVLGYAIDLGLGFALGQVLDRTAGAVMKLLVLLLWWPFVVRMALKKRYLDFRIVLIPHSST